MSHFAIGLVYDDEPPDQRPHTYIPRKEETVADLFSRIVKTEGEQGRSGDLLTATLRPMIGFPVMNVGGTRCPIPS